MYQSSGEFQNSYINLFQNKHSCVQQIIAQ